MRFARLAFKYDLWNINEWIYCMILWSIFIFSITYCQFAMQQYVIIVKSNKPIYLMILARRFSLNVIFVDYKHFTILCYAVMYYQSCKEIMSNLVILYFQSGTYQRGVPIFKQFNGIVDYICQYNGFSSRIHFSVEENLFNF